MSSIRLPSETNWDVKDTITALAGGGQTNATALMRHKINRVTVVATAADSVMLPKADVLGGTLIVINATANSMNVYPFLGDNINALGANAAFAVAAGKSVLFVSPVAGTWYGNLSA